jgi:hypothetical protein
VPRECEFCPALIRRSKIWHLGESRELCEAAQTQLCRRSAGSGGDVVVVDELAHNGRGDDVADVLAFFERLKTV